MIMKRTTLANIFAIAAGTALALGLAPTAKADQACSNATLNGTFAYTNTGFITAPPTQAGPFAGVGTQTFDGKGATIATATVSQNGNIIPVTIKGVYTVNPDCTGTLTIQISPVGITSHAFFVIEDNGARLRAINTDPGTVVTTIGRKQFPASDSRH
jgi:hypothetical protein